MNMIDFLSETEYAVKNIIDLISNDKTVLAQYQADVVQLENKICELKNNIKLLYQDFRWKDTSDDVSEMQIM